MLRRLGNKTKLLPKLLELFPEDVKTFIDIFMGSGAVTFAMVDHAKYVISNDNDNEVFNLFQVVREHTDELVDAIQMMPIHENLFQYWRKHEEHEPVWRAARFLMLSNFGYLGHAETLAFDSVCNPKKQLLPAVTDVFKRLAHVQLMCCDFRDVLPRIKWKLKDFGRPAHHKDQAFIYADPPYMDRETNYHHRTCMFTQQDTQELFSVLVNSEMRFALSEFENPIVLDLAQKYGLYVNIIGERQTLKNRNTEIVITNYEPVQKQPPLFHGLSMN